MADLTIEERIRERAYILWERAGCPEGRHDEFWQLACDQVDDEEGPLPPGVTETHRA